MIYRLVTHTFAFLHLHQFKTLPWGGLHLLSGWTGTVRGLSVMIKWCGAIWCKVLGEFGLVPSISLEKVNGAWCEAQLCSEPFFVTLPIPVPLLYRRTSHFASFIQHQTVGMSHDGGSWDCGGGHILDGCHHPCASLPTSVPYITEPFPAVGSRYPSARAKHSS